MTAHIKWMKKDPVTTDVIKQIVDALIYHKQSTGRYLPGCYGIFSDGDSVIYNLGRMLTWDQQPEEFLPEDIEDRDMLLEIFNRCIPLIKGEIIK